MLLYVHMVILLLLALAHAVIGPAVALGFSVLFSLFRSCECARRQSLVTRIPSPSTTAILAGVLVIGGRDVPSNNRVRLVRFLANLAELNVVHGFLRPAFCKVLLILCRCSVCPTVCGSEVCHCVSLCVLVCCHAPHYNMLSS